MAHNGHPASEQNTATMSLQPPWLSARALWPVLAAAALFTLVITAGNFVPARGAPEPAMGSKAATGVAPVALDEAKEPEAAVAGAAPGQAAVATSSTSIVPNIAASSWSMAPVFVSPAPAPAVSAAAADLAAGASQRFGLKVDLDGQDWGRDQQEQERNIGAVISAIDALPRTVSSSIVAGPNGAITVLSNRQGRTENGWQPYGDLAPNFYTNSDRGPAGEKTANEIILLTGADSGTIAHEMLHAYQFRQAEPDGYVAALLGSEMKSFMQATGWRQLVRDDELMAAQHSSWSAIDKMFAYEGRDPVLIQAAGLDFSNPLEAFASAGAMYYTRKATGAPLPLWTELWSWFDANLG